MDERTPELWKVGDRTDDPIEPSEIAYYVHCRSGMTPVEFIGWLCRELETLAAIDPECSK